LHRYHEMPLKRGESGKDPTSIPGVPKPFDLAACFQLTVVLDERLKYMIVLYD